VSWITRWTFRREANWMLWLGLLPALLMALAMVVPWLRRLLSSG